MELMLGPSTSTTTTGELGTEAASSAALTRDHQLQHFIQLAQQLQSHKGVPTTQPQDPLVPAWIPLHSPAPSVSSASAARLLSSLPLMNQRLLLGQTALSEGLTATQTSPSPLSSSEALLSSPCTVAPATTNSIPSKSPAQQPFFPSASNPFSMFPSVNLGSPGSLLPPNLPPSMHQQHPWASGLPGGGLVWPPSSPAVSAVAHQTAVAMSRDMASLNRFDEVSLHNMARLGLPPSFYNLLAMSDPNSEQRSVPNPQEILENWRQFQQAALANNLDPYYLAFSHGMSMEAHGLRRKNATRETTHSLKAWLMDHGKNPYPTKGEKIMLAVITRMTLTQVSTWFANARRRLKKETRYSQQTSQHHGSGNAHHHHHHQKQAQTASSTSRDLSSSVSSTGSSSSSTYSCLNPSARQAPQSPGEDLQPESTPSQQLEQDDHHPAPSLSPANSEDELSLTIDEQETADDTGVNINNNGKFAFDACPTLTEACPSSLAMNPYSVYLETLLRQASESHHQEQQQQQPLKRTSPTPSSARKRQKIWSIVDEDDDEPTPPTASSSTSVPTEWPSPSPKFCATTTKEFSFHLQPPDTHLNSKTPTGLPCSSGSSPGTQ